MTRDTTYYPSALWVDIESGTYGNAKNIVTLDLELWADEDVHAWENMTDSERQDYARVVMEANEQTATPLVYMKQEEEYRAGLR
jgi:hypothetical protein